MSFAAVLTLGTTVGTTLGMTGTLATTVGTGLLGAGIGAGVGQLTGGNTKSTLKGMGIGGGIGLGVGGIGSLAGFEMAGSTAPEVAGTELAGGLNADITGGVAEAAVKTGSETSQVSGWSTALSSLANPLMLGTAALGMSAGYGSQGQAFQDKISLTREGKELMYGKGGGSGKPLSAQGGLAGAAYSRFKAASEGKFPERAAPDINKAKRVESSRSKASMGAFASLAATRGNAGENDLGYAAGGGQEAKLSYTDSGERMAGLFSPTSILNKYSKSELVNSIGHLQNIYNLENQTAAVNYSGSVAEWQSNRMLSANRGAAIGGALQMLGNHALNSAYYSRLKALS